MKRAAAFFVFSLFLALAFDAPPVFAKNPRAQLVEMRAKRQQNFNDLQNKQQELALTVQKNQKVYSFQLLELQDERNRARRAGDEAKVQQINRKIQDLNQQMAAANAQARVRNKREMNEIKAKGNAIKKQIAKLQRQVDDL